MFVFDIIWDYVMLRIMQNLVMFGNKIGTQHIYLVTCSRTYNVKCLFSRNIDLPRLELPVYVCFSLHFELSLTLRNDNTICHSRDHQFLKQRTDKVPQKREGKKWKHLSRKKAHLKVLSL